jgi:hypothetical protein
MAIPGQRRSGQTGGRYGHNTNTRLSRARGGSPGASRGGGGGGKKGGCLILVPVTLGALYGMAEIMRAVL